jgi:hypothetical protein
MADENIFDDIGNAFKTAGGAVADAAKSAASQVADAGGEAWSFSDKVLVSGALALADGANIFQSGWRDVFSGNFEKGLAEMGVGLCEMAGVLPPQYASYYEEVLGQASLWSLQQSKTRDKQICFSEYVGQVKQNIERQNLKWTDNMPDVLRGNLHDMPWINPGC